MLYISNTLLCIPISILIKAMQTKQNASGEGKYVQICALSSDMKKKNPESVSDIIRNHLGDFFLLLLFLFIWKATKEINYWHVQEQNCC